MEIEMKMKSERVRSDEEWRGEKRKERRADAPLCSALLKKKF